jgi:hypothetical protein
MFTPKKIQKPTTYRSSMTTTTPDANTVNIQKGNEGGLPTTENALSLLNGANPSFGFPLGSEPTLSPRAVELVDANVAAAV